MGSRLVQPGDAAPAFSLPAVERDCRVSLADYLGKSSLLLALFRGIYCSFCRRRIVQLSLVGEELRSLGVETLGIVASDVERARLYFRFRPVRVPLAADPEMRVHRAYGVPKPAVTPEYLEVRRTVRINPTGELPDPVPAAEIGSVLRRLDGFEMTEIDRRDMERGSSQQVGEFLIDSSGIIRWLYIEGATDGVAGRGMFPSREQLVAAARAVAR